MIDIKNMRKISRFLFVVLILVLFVKMSSAQEVLIKTNNGVQWFVPVKFFSSSFSCQTNNFDKVIIDEYNSGAKSITLHNGTPGQDNPPNGMIINIVNRSNRALPFSCGGACGYESISGSFTNASIAANSSLVLQWNSAISRWYEIL